MGISAEQNITPRFENNTRTPTFKSTFFVNSFLALEPSKSSCMFEKTLRFRKDGVHLSGMEYSHSDVLERECTFPEWNAHTPRLWRVHLSRMECSHSEVSERWSAPFWNRIRWSTFFRNIIILCLHCNVWKDRVHYSETSHQHSEVLKDEMHHFRTLYQHSQVRKDGVYLS